MRSEEAGKMGRTVYLGKRVEDRRSPGLDTLTEVEDICKAILDDWKKGRISYAKAVRRLVFLKTTVIKRNEKLRGKKRKAYAIVDKYLSRIRKERERKGKKNKGKKRKRSRKTRR